MAHAVEMPRLGFDMAEGTLVRWVKREGDPVTKGEVIAEIETDKATVEVEAHHSGVMLRQIAPEGSIVPVGQTIAVIGEAGEAIDLAAPGLIPAPEAAPAPGPGPLAPTAIPAPEPESPAPTVTPAPGAPPAPPESGLPGGVRASPLARKMAQQRGLDLSRIPGSGPGGRIVRSDVESYTPAAAPAFAPLTPAAEGQTLPLSRLRRAIARRMTEAKTRAPHFYVTAEFDMAPLMALRARLNEVLAEQQVKLSVNDFIVKACALALRQYPNLNASFQGDALLRHGQINVGIAVAVEGGLLTVVTRDTDRKPLAQLAAEARALIASARSGKVRPEEISGSTFSVSNLGMYEVENFIAIINPPEAAILAVGSVMDVPVVKDSQLAVGTRMKATLSADHRVTDGAEAAQFLQAVRTYLEQPLRLLL